jgi:2-polyprenyl-3-methyl-5-hydroxy-6-metoxy-1,4-benzoquinol methylase
MNLNLFLHRALRIPTASDYIKSLVGSSECSLTLDVGCGGFSHLTRFRPRINTVGLDLFPEAIEKSKAINSHDQYIVGDILNESAEGLLASVGGQKFDLVMLYDIIEHVPKRQGFELLEKCEQLTSKFILLQTPNGFLPQGPENGNEHQRHLSGWFLQEFEGLGYKVYGARGTKYLRGYAAGPKYDFFGWMTCDIVLAGLLRIRNHPRHAFNLVAIKDVRGVPARFN